jgi:hypothetical protein
MKSLSYIIGLFLLIVFEANAQDKIVKTNGETITGKVQEVGIDRITYKIDAATDAAIFTIRKKDIHHIEFENGQVVQVYQEAKSTSTQKMIPVDLGKNLVNISPVKFMDIGQGFGISYERIMDKKGIFSLVLPVSLIFPDDYVLFEGDKFDGATMVYFSPGLKIYPFGQKKVTYAIGPSLFYGKGKRSQYYYDASNNYGYKATDCERSGIMINNYINFQITPKFQFGMHAGLGTRYYDKFTNGGGDILRELFSITGEFNFNLGFRF